MEIRSLFSALLISGGVLTLAGCGNRDINLKDSNALAMRVSFESKPSKRVMLRGSYERFNVKHDDFSLDRQYDDDNEVIRINDTLWQGPAKVDAKANIDLASLDATFLPIANDHVQMHIGGGLRYSTTQFEISGQRRTDDTDFSAWGVGATVGARYQFSPTMAVSANLNHTFLRASESPQNLDITLMLSWMPIKPLQFDIGLFDYSMEIREGLNTSMRVTEFDCVDDVDHYDCPSEERGNSDFTVESTGLKAGITFRF